jgi:predicted Zn finger-like uncharacterized protein
MPATTVACPHCHAALRSSRPVPAGRTVRCPGCNTSFVADSVPSASPRLSVSAPAPGSLGSALRLTSPLFLLALVGSLLAGLGVIIVAAIVAAQHNAPPTSEPVVSPPVAEVPKPPARNPLEDARLQAERQKLHEEREALAREKRKLECGRLNDEGRAALAKKDYTAAETAFKKSLSLADDDAELRGVALAGLVDVRSAMEAIRAARESDTDRKDRLEKLLAAARKAKTDGQLAAAVRDFELALTLSPDDAMVRKELADARDAIAADQAEKKKLADYQDHMTAGRAHLIGNRFADALREFLAAGRIMPGDPEATRGRRAAEAGLAALAPPPAPPVKGDDGFNDRLDRSRKALTARRYQEAVDNAEAALKIRPDDTAARQQLRTARDAWDTAKTNAQPLLAQGATALRLGRYEEAFKYFTDASQLLPDDPVATQGLTDARNGLNTIQLGNAAYVRYMELGVAALRTKRYADAVAAFTEALRVQPGDPDALRGLREANVKIEKRVVRNTEITQALTAASQAMTSRRYSDAVKALTTAQSLDPDNPKIASQLNEARYQMYMQAGQKAGFAGQRSEQIKAYQSALEIRPGDPSASAALRSAQAGRSR